jgi:hypothetical protein
MKLDSIRDAYRVRPGYWFRPKLFGWGAVPVTWQGWAATATFLALAYAATSLAKERGPAWLILLVPILLGYVLLAWAKTDGGWAFRWGPDTRD